jgi:hypothetical protein
VTVLFDSSKLFKADASGIRVSTLLYVDAYRWHWLRIIER